VSDCLASILFKEEGSDFSKIRFHELSVKSIIDERLQDEKEPLSWDYLFVLFLREGNHDDFAAKVKHSPLPHLNENEPRITHLIITCFQKYFPKCSAA